MYGVRLLGIGRLILSIAKLARVDVGLDDTQPNLRAGAVAHTPRIEIKH